MRYCNAHCHAGGVVLATRRRRRALRYGAEPKGQHVLTAASDPFPVQTSARVTLGNVWGSITRSWTVHP